MDLWIVATAAGAGYLAKHWQKLLKDGNSSSQLSSMNSNFEEPESPVHGIAPRKQPSEDVLADNGEGFSGRSFILGQSPSIGGNDCKKLEILENYEDYVDISISNMPMEFSTNKNLQTFGQRNNLDGYMDDGASELLPCSSSRAINHFLPTLRKTTSLRSRCSYRRFVKPLSSLESCMMSHLYKEHVEMEEFILHSLQSPSTSTMRQLVVNDGSQIISKSVKDSFSLQIDMGESNFHEEAFFEKNRNVYGVPLLPKVQSFKNSKIINVKAGGREGGEVTNNKNQSHPKGMPDRVILFCLGISIGFISSLIASKCEVDKLNMLLKHKENLVQDLQEELEMKDSLTVKELLNENCESQGGISENSFYDGTTKMSFLEQGSLARLDGGKFHHDAKSSESLSKIEAELEAELQRLGLNVDTSNADRKISDFLEFDAEFTRDFSDGELRADMISGRSATQLQQNEVASKFTYSENYAVSPRELSLRLHEVIQSRLEARVRELETALENSERKLRQIETEHKSSQYEYAPSELQYSSSEERSNVEPLVMNLSGEALDAYNEAFKELSHMDDFEEQKTHSPSEVNESKLQQSQIAINAYPLAIPNGKTRTSESTTIKRAIDEEKSCREGFPVDMGTKEEELLLGQLSNEVNGSEDESSDYGDEMELIKRIVERTKRGSPVVLNAQKWLSSMDKDDG